MNPHRPSLSHFTHPSSPQNCDTTPLTLYEHTCYYPHRSNITLTISRRNQKLGKPTRPTRGLNASAHPNGSRAGPRHKRKTPSPHPHRVPCPFPTPRRWKTSWTQPGTGPPEGRAIAAERCSAPLAGRTTWSALNLPANRMSPRNPGLQGPSSPSGGRGTHTLGDFLPPDRLHKHKWDEQAGLPPLHKSPGPSIACPFPTDKPKTHKPHNRRSASGGLNKTPVCH